MRKLKIVLVMIEPPLPFGNAAARWFYVLLKQLVERGHNVTAFATCSNQDDIERVRQFFPTNKYDLRCYAYPLRGGFIAKLKTLQQPYSYVFSEELLKDLHGELRKPFDILHLEQLWSGWLGLQYAKRSVLCVHYLFSIDRACQPAVSVGDKIRWFITLRAEKKLMRNFDNIITLSDRLSKNISRINPRANVYTVPVGIDFTLYPFSEEMTFHDRPTVGLIGSFNWTPSYYAAERLIRDLWPRIKERVCGARLLIVGRSAKDMLVSFKGMPDVEIYQDVPDAVPYFREFDVLLYAPPVGSGMKVKVLEAFALGVPVVTTSAGIEGIHAEDGVHAGISDDNVGLIDRTVRLLNNPALRQVQRRNARVFIEEFCSPQVTVGQVEMVYTKIVDS